MGGAAGARISRRHGPVTGVRAPAGTEWANRPGKGHQHAHNPPNKRTVAVLGGATALLLLGGVGGAVAAGQISGQQIKDHTITAKDLKKSSVRSIAIKNGNVKAQDLAAGVLAGITGPTGATGATGAPAPRVRRATRARPVTRGAPRRDRR